MPPSSQSQEYAAAEGMLQLPHATSQGHNGFAMPEMRMGQSVQEQLHHIPPVPISPYQNYSVPYDGGMVDQSRAYMSMSDSATNMQQSLQRSYSGQPARGSASENSEGRGSNASGRRHRASSNSMAQSGYGNHMGSIDESEANSSMSPNIMSGQGSGGQTMLEHHLNPEGASNKQLEIKEEGEKPPPWSELKTKAGKDRKRLPLACIACRRKKIRCSGEKPACKHCLRSRIPCVYKVTARKAVPRTDYMSMLDKRLKRMEERVIKIIPKEEAREASAIGRANVRPPSAGQSARAQAGKKRAAAEAFGPDLGINTTAGPPPFQKASSDPSGVFTEGVDQLPSKELQVHLSEVFFDCCYGQSYYLLHKPSFMRKLR